MVFARRFAAARVQPFRAFDANLHLAQPHAIAGCFCHLVGGN
jgi:hypothetical protein